MTKQILTTIGVTTVVFTRLSGVMTVVFTTLSVVTTVVFTTLSGASTDTTRAPSDNSN